jgi:O-methyltransferase
VTAFRSLLTITLAGRFVVGWFRFTSHYGVRDRDKFYAALDMLRESLANPDGAHFFADNLITFGKVVGFLEDKAFTDAVSAENPSGGEMALLWRTHILAWGARKALGVPGDFVEAGCYKGYSAKVICNLTKFQTLDRRYWIYDLFGRNPDRALQLSEQGPELLARVRDRFSAYPNVQIVPGSVPDCLRDGSPERIAFMHVDMNSVPAELGLLEALFDRVSPGGVLVFDDYGWSAFANQHQAVKAFFDRRGIPVAELPTGQGLVVV